LTAGGPTGGIEAAVTLASAYVDARNHSRAEQVLREALTASPDSSELLANLARVQILMKDHRAAAVTAYAALVISPEDAFALRMYAIALDGIGRLHDALSVAWRSAINHPHDRLAHYVYAELLLKAGRAHDALYVVGEVLRLDPANTDNHVLRGQILARLNRSRESTAAYEEALRLDPGNAAAVHNIAVNRLAGGRWSKAFRGFLGAARLDPELGDLARRNIGAALARQLRIANLIVLFLAFLALMAKESPDSVGPRVWAGILAATLFVRLAWLSRMVPLRTWRSVLAARQMLIVRLGLTAYAIAVGVVAAVDPGGPVTSPAAPTLLALTVIVMLIGRAAGG
jgi:Flp pilus assembly protein TadD